MRIMRRTLERIVKEELTRALMHRGLLVESDGMSNYANVRFGAWNEEHPPASPQTYSADAGAVLGVIGEIFMENMTSQINDRSGYDETVWGGEPLRPASEEIKGPDGAVLVATYAGTNTKYRLKFEFNQNTPAEMGEGDDIDPGVTASISVAPDMNGKERPDLTSYLQDQLAAGYSPSDMSALDESDQRVYKMALHHLTPRVSSFYADIPLGLVLIKAATAVDDDAGDEAPAAP